MGATLLAAASPLAWATQAEDATEAQKIVSRAQGTLQELLSDKELDSLRAGLKKAKAVLIFPTVLKAGFMLGGSGGHGVLLVRHGAHDWSAPAFYTMGSVSFGLQAGAQDSAVAILVNSDKAVASLMDNSVRLGGGFSAAVGPQGVGQGANLTADFVSYSKAKGAFLGMSLEGSVLDVRDTLNQAYYGKALKPAQIVKLGKDPHAGGLRGALAAAAK
jgi:lipid-binding SYLF domain-containing protein